MWQVGVPFMVHFYLAVARDDNGGLFREIMADNGAVGLELFAGWFGLHEVSVPYESVKGVSRKGRRCSR